LYASSVCNPLVTMLPLASAVKLLWPDRCSRNTSATCRYVKRACSDDIVVLITVGVGWDDVRQVGVQTAAVVAAVAATASK
jgi:hypothetical protein